MTNNTKLINILRDKKVHISGQNNICLNDFINNVIKSKNPDTYARKISNNDQIIIKKEVYISPETCIELLKNSKFNRCKKIYHKIQIVNDDKTSLIDVDNQIFQFEGRQFLSFFVHENNEWDVWIKGSEIAEFLGYTDVDKSIRCHVEEKNKCFFSKLCQNFDPANLAGLKKIDSDNLEKSKFLHPSTIFINLSGFFNLIHVSKKPLAQKIRSWIDNEVMPALIKYGKYKMQLDKLKVNHFYEAAMLSDFDKKAVLYIAHIGQYKGEAIFKYGLSRNMFSREYHQHRKHFETFNVIFIGESDNCEKIESLFEKELKIRNIHRSFVINKKNQTELFTVSDDFTYEYLVDLMKTLINNHKLPAIKKADDEISNLTSVVDTYKQSEELRKLELQFRLSENYKLELERDIRIKELEFEKDIRIKELDNIAKELDIQLQHEKNKQIAMENGYDSEYVINKVTRNPKNTKTRKKYEIIRL